MKTKLLGLLSIATISIPFFRMMFTLLPPGAPDLDIVPRWPKQQSWQQYY